MTTLDRRSFLKTTAAVGLTTLPTARGSVGFAADDD
ncbi:MAG: twin-arginine translocation signal domain-containing protein, partial [Vicinamibacteria bacterium]